jgi:hypothetical protein
MRLRLQRWMRSDRAWWTLVALTLVGVTTAYYLAREAEKRQTEWVHGLEPSGPRLTEPAIAEPAAPPAGALTPANPTLRTDSGTQIEPAAVVELITTPSEVTVGPMTAACTEAMRARGGPWKNAAAAEPWPACVDAEGRPMLIQFCTYARLASGEWVHATNTASAPRCQAELPLLRQGKVRGVVGR